MKLLNLVFNMNESSDKPYFTVHLIAPDKHFRWCIAMNGKVIHHIAHMRFFAKNIGYPDPSSTVIDDQIHFNDIQNYFNKKEAITENDDTSSDLCTQYKITDYLYKNCERFKAENGDYYASVIQNCKSHFDISRSKCTNCLILNE
jgi:hypothetical protein